MVSVGDGIFLSIQEQICVETFPKISANGVPKLKQQEHQWFSNDRKTARVHQHFQQTWEMDPSPISIHLCKHSVGPGMGLAHPSGGQKPKFSTDEVLNLVLLLR